MTAGLIELAPFEDANRRLLRNVPVSFFLPGTNTLAQLWTGPAKTVAHPNPVSTDSFGNLPPVYADPGRYEFELRGLRLVTEVQVTPSYADARYRRSAQRLAPEDLDFALRPVLPTVPRSGVPARPIYDDFTAPNGTSIAGRVAPSGHVWSVTGAGAATTSIQDNAFASTGGLASYIYTDLVEPVARIEAVLVNGGTTALLVNRADKGVLEEVIHLSMHANGWTLSLIHGDINTGTQRWEDIATGRYGAPLAVGGNHRVAMVIVADTILLELPGLPAPVAYRHPSIAIYAGSRATFEIMNDAGERMTTVRAAGASAGLLLPAASTPLGPNLVPRASSVMDSSAHGWANVANAVVARVTDRTLYGAGALQVESSAVASVQARIFTFLPLPAGGGRWYTLQMAISMPGATATEKAGPGVQLFDAANAPLVYIAGTQTPLTEAWQTVFLHFFAPATATQCAPRVVMNAPSAVGRRYYVDKVAIVEGLATTWTDPA